MSETPAPRDPGQYRDENGEWIEEGNTVIVAPSGQILVGPVRQREETLVADLDLGDVLAARRRLDPVGHYHRPDIFRLHVDTPPRSPERACPAAGQPRLNTPLNVPTRHSHAAGGQRARPTGPLNATT